jgi:alpha-D-ribose 1-methylphosphonate 5-triphosphate diphosphatase
MNILVREQSTVSITGGETLIDGAFQSAAVEVNARTGLIEAVDSAAATGLRFRADGLLVLPGIVDIHGDAFERQMMPRPGVGFPLDVAFAESDRQAVANGITTVFHGLTWSWEPGLRGTENARAVVACIERMRPHLAADTYVHLRHETYNLDAEVEIIEWLRAGRVAALAFNDHMSSIVEASGREKKLSQMVERAGISRDAFIELVEKTKRRADEVPASMKRLAQAAVASGVPLLSHDDTSPEQRQWFRELGCRLAEFPTTVETAQAASEAGDNIIMGAPNVVRGGSHTGWTNAADMIGRGFCSILASDYYYPAPLLAAFRLAADGVLPLEKAWPLVSTTPAAAVGLGDRGRIAAGQRADMILVDASDRARPRLVATLAGGRFVHVADATRFAR